MRIAQLSLTLAVLAVALTAADPAHALWKWRDASGKVQYTDRPPPAGVAEKDILQRPTAAPRSDFAPRPQAAASAASEPLAAPAVKATDPQLEAKKREQDQAAEKAKKDKQEQVAKSKAENCSRARGYEKTLGDGYRVARTNEKGEREILDDAARAKETARVKEVIARDCAP